MKTVPRIAGALAVLALVLASCQAPGMGEDEPAPTRTPGEAISPDTTQQVTMATFTPTVEGETPETAVTQEANRAAQQTAAAATATHQAANPQPTGTVGPNATPVNPAPNPNATGTPANALRPPMARLISGSDRIDSTLGSYSWQFGDTARSFVRISAPLMEITDVALTAQSGSEVTLEFSGQQYTEPPQEITVTGYVFEESTSIPTTVQGQTGDELVFAPPPDAATPLEASPDPQNPSFGLALEPGHYILKVEANWGSHPELQDQQIYVTYVFNVIVE